MRRLLNAALLAAAAVVHTEAAAFPDRPLRIIVPYAPGGSSDTVARVIALRLTETLGQQVIVDNRPGAGATIGTDAVAKAAADGYTLLLADSPHTINPSFYPKLPFDPVADFAPITLVGSAPYYLVVGVSGAASLRDLIGAARAKPGAATFGSAGNGSSSHVFGEHFQQGAGIKLTHVPYKGAAPAITDAIAGQVTMSFVTFASAGGHLRAGRLRALAVTGSARHPSTPDVPTFAEGGVEGMLQEQWWAFLAPSRTPREVIERLHREILAALTQPAIRERFVGLGVDVKTNSPEQFRSMIVAELARWAAVVKAAGIKIE